MQKFAIQMALVPLFLSAIAEAAPVDVSGTVHVAGIVKSSHEENCSVALTSPAVTLHGTQLDDLGYMTEHVDHYSADTVGISLS
ncbi:hypothetical protein INF70_21750, partial [Enterobacter cloacae complex sp. P4RS]|uniref:hypothetical protein n=1 Tax=Enterobacter cloacae complex sp. P4RS TaxID=2779590 RepID=UPI001876C180